MLDLVSWWSDPGENVVDPMAGSGTTALACKLLDRSCFAIEQDPKWADVAARRLALQWNDRDRARAAEWCATTTADAGEHLAKKPAKNGEDENTRRRAQCRLDDADRVARYL
jgi:predicted Zn-dependent protease